MKDQNFRLQQICKTPGVVALIRTTTIGLLVLWATAPEAQALGVRIPNQDAAAIARGNAFVATADNPSALYYNPAGIAQLEGQHFQAGSLLYLGIYGDYESPSGQKVENDPEVIPAPSFQYTYTPKDCPFSVGFGAYTPFGFSVKWPEDAPFRTGAIEGSLAYMTLNPVIAWKIHPTFSIAAGPTFNYSTIDVRQGLLPLANIVPGDHFGFNGDGWGYGFNVGALWQPHPKWSVGLSYRSSSRMNYEGDAELYPAIPPLPGSAETSSKLDFPQILIGGISFRPTPDWNFEFDVDWADWTSFDQLSVPPYPAQPLEWKSSFMYEVGATRYLSGGYFLSAGYFFSQASTPDQLFTPLVPDTDLHIGSLGGGYKGQRWDWAVAVQVIGGGWRTVDNAANPAVNGRYKLFTPTLSFSVGYHF